MAIVINEAAASKRSEEAIPLLEQGDRFGSTKTTSRSPMFCWRSNRLMAASPTFDEDGYLDRAAMLKGDLVRVFAVLQEGIASPEHRTFVAALQKRHEGSV